MTTTPADPHTALRGEVDAVDAHLARVDTKAGLLLALVGAAATAAPFAITASNLPTAATVTAILSAAAFTGAAILLAAAIRPALTTRSRTPYGFAAYANTPAAAIPDRVQNAQTPDALAQRLADLSTAVAGKYRRIRTATDLALFGLGLVAGTAILAAVCRG